MFGVWESGVPTTLNFKGGANVNVGDGTVGMAAILGALTVNGTVPDFDQPEPERSSRRHRPDSHHGHWQYQRTRPRRHHYSALALAILIVNGGTGANTFNVLSTPAGYTTINDAGSDTVNVGDVSGMQDIVGQLTVNSVKPGSVHLNLDDQADPTGRTVTMATGSVSGLAPVNIDYGASALASLIVNGGLGTLTFNVQSTPATTTTTINAAGPATVNVGDASGVQHILGLLIVNSTVAGAVHLNLNDQSDPTGRTVTMASGSVTGLAPANIDYGVSALVSLIVNGGTGALTFNVLSTPAPPTPRSTPLVRPP